MYLLAPFILQNFKRTLTADPELWCAILEPRWPICPEQNFFGKNHYYYFHLPIGPFQCAKFKKILTVDPELWGCTIFGPKMVCLSQTEIFLEKIIKIIFIYLLAPFIEQNFKNILTVDPQLRGCTIFGPKMAHLPKWEFFSEKLLICLVPFTHAYLHAKIQSKILIYQWNIDN